jgi:DNA-binding NarL/FixJ family response regulator
VHDPEPLLTRAAGTLSVDRRVLGALNGIYTGLARLRRIDDPTALIRRVPEEVCRSLGFERSVLFRVQGETLIAQSAFHRGGPARGQRLLESWRGRLPRLPELPLESQMIRRREALPAGETPISAPALTGSYVSAPIVSEGRVVGFLHADRKHQTHAVDELDRAVLSVFADGFACAFERSTLRERLRAQLEQVREVMDTTDQLLDEVFETEIEVGLADQHISNAVAQAASAIAEPGIPASLSLLTPREVEVIELIATGETNAGIANRLLISESTVKSHVKHILRKLGASHRAEAVSRHLAATGRR